MSDSLFTPGEIANDLNLLERTLHQLGVDYELFFVARADGKVNVLPPSRRMAEVEAIVRHYTKSPPRRTADRFRFNTLVHRFRMNSERWSRRLRQQEEQGIGGRGAGSRRDQRTTPDVSKPAVLAAARASEGLATSGQMRDLYAAFRNARKARGLAVGDLEYAPFADKLLERIAEARRRAPGRDIEMRIDEIGGKVRVAVRPVAPREEKVR